jgi:hypothetical protein
MTAIRALMSGLIDYAGLFPPAALEMPEAMAQYDEHRRGPHAGALGRFIVPLARILEVQAAGWKLSVLALPGEALPTEVDSVEMKVERAADIARLSVSMPALRYFEIPVATDPSELIAAMAESGSRAKVRAGGLTVDAFPTAPDLARFLCACAESRVPFKATAGLHHPLPSPPMHGFITLFLAAALAWHGGSRQEVTTTLLETAPSAFVWEEAAVTWHGHRLSTAQILAAREQFAIAFGSCSFDEPLRDLEALGWI